MTDQPTPDHASSDPSKRTDWDAVSETELDAALSQAASLAAELSAQVSSPEDAAAPAAPSCDNNPSGDPSRAVDAGLEKLEELVGSAAEQVEAVPAAKASPPQALSVPDFMSEFTSPPPPAPPSPPPPPPPIPEVSAVEVPVAAAPEPRTMPPPPREFQSTAGGAVIGKPGVVGSGMMGVVGGPVNIPAMTAPRPAEPQVEAEHKEPAAAVAAKKTGRVAPLQLVLQGLVAMLEMLDRPFVRLGAKVRRILGWVAVAMIGASILVFLRSSR